MKKCKHCDKNLPKTHRGLSCASCRSKIYRRGSIDPINDAPKLCTFCGIDCKNANSHRNHERLCEKNPNRQKSSFANPTVQSLAQSQKETFGYSNQFIKARTLGLPDPIVSDQTRRKIGKANSERSDEWHRIHGKQVSDTINKKVAAGEWHFSAVVIHEYRGEKLHSSWELKYAKYLDENNISWRRPTESFPYQFDGVWRRYFPDFYLIDTDEYVEIKGWKRDSDDAKWSQFPSDRNLTIIMEKEMKELGLL